MAISLVRERPVDIDPLSRSIMERSALRLQKNLNHFFLDGASLPVGFGDCPLCHWISYFGETLGSTSVAADSPVRSSHAVFHRSLEEARAFGESDPGRLVWILKEAEAAGQQTALALRSLS
jgi:hypothetical protein